MASPFQRLLTNPPEGARRLQRRRQDRLEIRPPIPPERTLIQELIRSRWIGLQRALIKAHNPDLILLDDEMIGAITISAGPLSELHPIALSSFQQPRRVPWVVAGCLWLDRRIVEGAAKPRLNNILDLAGPQWAALAARRFGYPGFVAALCLPGYPGLRHQLSPAGYVQQVAFGDLDEPALVSYLRFGAHFVDIIDDQAGPLAILQWRDPYR